MAWTEERIAKLKQGWESGMTASQIADMLGEGVSRNAVIGKAHRLGLESRPSPVRSGDETVPVAPAAPVSGTSAPVVPAAARPASTGARPAARKPAKPARAARTTLLDLSDKVCKWPIGHPGDADFHFCGKAANPGFPYCNDHCLVAYQAQLPRRDRDRRPPPVLPGMGPRR